jgi:predicted PurR-regulated permease PerM
MRAVAVNAAAYVITGVVLVAVLELHLLAALFAGLLVYEVVHIIAPHLPAPKRGGEKQVAVALIATAVVIALVGAVFGFLAFLQSDAGSLPNLVQKLADTVAAARAKLPPWIVEYLPADADAVNAMTVGWLREHSAELRLVGGEVGRDLLHVVIGMIIGGMVSLREARDRTEGGPLTLALLERATRVGDAFRRVVFAQTRIAAINTAFTAIYLIVLLPLAGVHLPYAKTLIAVTFLAGLLPVIGNLLSNTVILVVSLSVSLDVAIASLVFLVVIHKLEYFLNAKIVGSRIHAAPWELLVAMLVMEAAFGVAGLAAAPVYYAYLKDELSSRGLI